MKTKFRQPVLSTLVTLAATAVFLAACGGGQNTAEAQPPAETPMEAATVSEPTPEEVMEEAPSEPEAPEDTMPAAGEAGTFVIVPEESEVRFIIEEILAGVDTTVVGANKDVEGQIFLDLNNPQVVSMSPIRVDLSTLATDNDFRNQAIHRNILETGNEDFRYAQFEATDFVGIPESVTVGQAINFQIVGNLTIHGVTKEVTFDATVTPVSETRLEGLATLTVLYEDFGIQILRLPQQVASVESEVILELEFVAVAQ